MVLRSFFYVFVRFPLFRSWEVTLGYIQISHQHILTILTNVVRGVQKVTLSPMLPMWLIC